EGDPGDDGGAARSAALARGQAFDLCWQVVATNWASRAEEAPGGMPSSTRTIEPDDGTSGGLRGSARLQMFLLLARMHHDSPAKTRLYPDRVAGGDRDYRRA